MEAKKEPITLEIIHEINSNLYAQYEKLKAYESEDIKISCNLLLNAINRNVKYFTDQKTIQDEPETE